MKLFKYWFSRKSASPKGTVISYGRGPEGEEVIIDITETKHINLKVIITFFCLFASHDGAFFQQFMELDSLNVTWRICSAGASSWYCQFCLRSSVNWSTVCGVYPDSSDGIPDAEDQI